MIFTAALEQIAWPRHPIHFRLGRFAFAIILFSCLDRIAAGERQQLEAVHHAIERGLPFIEREGADWIATKDCVSCHHTSFMVWSLNAAARAGFSVDQAKLHTWTDWATNWQNLVVSASRATAVRDDTLRGQSDTVAQLLLVRSDSQPGSNRPQWCAEYASDLLKIQEPDGSWKSGGQLPSQKRPPRETQEVSTMWSLLALSASGMPNDSAATAAQGRARAWLGEKTIGQSTEWWATRLMLERKLGSADKANDLRAELLKRQRADGGWGWLCDDDSDALATGIALFALAEDKSAATQSAIARAQQFLIEKQLDDGSWPVRGTKQNKKDHVQPTATYWGTCWAVIGLCESLDHLGAK